MRVQIEGPVGVFGLDEPINQWVPKKQGGQFGMGRRNCAHLKPEVHVRTRSSLHHSLSPAPHSFSSVYSSSEGPLRAWLAPEVHVRTRSSLQCSLPPAPYLFLHFSPFSLVKSLTSVWDQKECVHLKTQNTCLQAFKPPYLSGCPSPDCIASATLLSSVQPCMY